MRILISGHAGFVGSHVAEELWSRGHKLYGIDDYSTGKKKNAHPSVIFRKKKKSITDRTYVKLMMEKFKPEVIVHLAAQPSLIESIKNPVKDARVNILGTVVLLSAAKKFGVRNFVFASTCATYGHPDHRITSPYAASKMAAERYIRLQSEQSYAILRFSNVYGPRQVPLGENQLVPRAMRMIYFGDEFYIYGDGEQTRDFIYVKDVASAVALAAEEPFIHDTLEVSYGLSFSVNQVVGTLKKITGYDPPIEHSEAKPHEPRHVEIPNQHTKDILNWHPNYGLDAGLRQTVKWWNNHA